MKNGRRTTGHSAGTWDFPYKQSLQLRIPIITIIAITILLLLLLIINYKGLERPHGRLRDGRLRGGHQEIITTTMNVFLLVSLLLVVVLVRVLALVLVLLVVI